MSLTDAHLPGRHGQKSHGGGGTGGHTKLGMPLTQMGAVGERLFVKNQRKAGIDRHFGKVRETPKVGGSGGRNPIDIVSDRYAIEVKTIDMRSKRLKVGIKAQEVAVKEAAAAAMGKDGAVVAQLLDTDAGTMQVWAFKGGFKRPGAQSGSFELTDPARTPMEFVGEYPVTQAHIDGALTAAARGEDEFGEKLEPGDTLIEYERDEHGNWQVYISTVPFRGRRATRASAADEVQLVTQPDGTREPEQVESGPTGPYRRVLDEALSALEDEAMTVVMGALAPVVEQVTARVLNDEALQALTAAAIDDLTTILDEWGVAVDLDVLPYFEEVYRVGGMSAVAQMAALGGAIPEPLLAVDAEYHAEAAARHLALARDRFLQVGRDAWEEARIVLLDGIDHRRGLDAIAANLRDVVTMTQDTAKMVARTEVISAANAGALSQARLAGEDAPLYKQWLATNDHRTRPSHDAADGQVVPLDSPFTVGGHPLDHPGDPAAPFEQVVNCRCSVIFTDDPAGYDVDTPLRGQGGVGGVVEDVADQVA